MSAPRTLLLALALALASLWGCTVDPAVYAGRACDADHPCADGRICGGTGFCVEPDGPGDNPDGSTGEPGACVVWRQSTQGFSGTETCPTCQTSIDSGNGHRLTATIPSAADGSDVAYGRVNLPPNLSAQEGRLRGDVRLSGPDVVSRSSFLVVRADEDELVSVSFSDKDEVGVHAQEGLLQPDEVSQTRETSVRFDEGGTFEFDLSWKRGEYLRLDVDGRTVLTQTLSALSGTPPESTELRLGIDGYSGTALTGWTITLSDWLYCDDPDAPL